MLNVDNYDDVIDSRDVIAKVEDIESSITDNENDLEEGIAELDRLEEELEKINAQIMDDDGSDDDALLEVKIARDEHETALAQQADEIDELRDDIKDLEEKLKPIKEFAEEGEGYGDWEHGETLIRESYWVEYVQQLAEDIGSVSSDAAWPYNHIDWEAAADELLIDYTTLDFDGETYYMRA